MRSFAQVVVILLIVLLVAVAAIVTGPQAQAEADRVRAETERQTSIDRIQRQYLQEKADVMAKIDADMERQKAAYNLQVWLQGEQNKLTAEYNQTIAQIDAARWDHILQLSLRAVGTSTLAIGFILLLLIANSVLSRKLGNWSERIDQGENKPPLYRSRDGSIIIPGNAPGTYIQVRKPTTPENWAYLFDMLAAIIHNTTRPARPGTEIVTQEPTSDGGWQVTFNRQRIELEQARATGSGSPRVRDGDGDSIGLLNMGTINALPFTAATGLLSAGPIRSELFELAAQNNLNVRDVIEGEVTEEEK